MFKILFYTVLSFPFCYSQTPGRNLLNPKVVLYRKRKGEPLITLGRVYRISHGVGVEAWMLNWILRKNVNQEEWARGHLDYTSVTKKL